MILHLRNKLTLSKPHSTIPHLILKCTREREGGLVLDVAVMLPPSTENGDLLLTLPPSNSHCHGNLLLIALIVLPPPISDQPTLGITLFPLCNSIKCNMYGHVWIFWFLQKKKKKNFEFFVFVFVSGWTLLWLSAYKLIFFLFFFFEIMNLSYYFIQCVV